MFDSIRPHPAMLALAALLLAAGCATTPRPPTSEEDAAATRSDATVEALLEELGAGDLAAVHARFNARMKSGLDLDRFAGGWQMLAGSLGEVEGASIVHRERRDGFDVRVAVMRFALGAIQLTISTDPETQELTGFYMKPIPKPDDPQAQEEADFRAEPVQVGAEPYLLDGILTLPRGQGPFPAAVLVHGSGPQDRDSTIGPNRPLRDIAAGLAAQGIATLRYDKRTFRYGDELDPSIGIDEEVVEDAVAAAQLLAARPEVDPARVWVVGHSLGALLAPEIAARAGGVAGVILLAPPGQAPWDAVLMQLRHINASEEELAVVEKAVERLREGEAGADTILLGVPAAYWQDWASRDGIAWARELAKPMLILRGDRDYQVTEVDLAAWIEAFGDDPKVRVEIVPGVNHLFIHGEGRSEPAEYFRPGRVDQRVIDSISTFILSQPPRE